MAPPISQSASFPDDSYGGQSAASASVFNWQEVPANQQVPIRRAVFDQGGYQLYDNEGETIIVPFVNNNLYVMKFAVSPNGKTFFVNDGREPVLYVPRNGYLENATVDGARWFPFSDRFHPETPVFLGIAPSWSAYCGMGWYPDMYYHGGYWCGTAIGIFTPSFGLFFEIGGHHFDGWDPYIAFVSFHPDYYRIGYWHPDNYRWAERPYWGGRSFHGYDGYLAEGGHFPGGPRDHSFGGGRTFYGAGHPYAVESRSASVDRSFGGGDHAYVRDDHAAGGENREFGAPRTYSGNVDRGADVQFHNDHTFRGAGGSSYNNGGGYQASHEYTGGRGGFESAQPHNSSANGGGAYSGARDRGSYGASSQAQDRTPSGNHDRSFNSDSRSSGGGDRHDSGGGSWSGGDHSFHGGDHGA